MLQTYVKTPEAVLPFGLDLTDWLDADDSVTSATVELVGEDKLTLEDETAQIVDGNAVYARLSGGIVGDRQAVKFIWTTAAGLVDSRIITISVVPR